MTKSQEIETLLKCVNTLGTDSYCGEWLRDQMPFIEHDMKCDIMPTPTWSDTRKLHDSTITLAKDQANRIIKSAQKDADEIIQDAETKAEIIRINLRRDLEKALNLI